jgi:hypothetical protein
MAASVQSAKVPKKRLGSSKQCKVRHWDINRLPYDVEADRWFDPAWLVAGGHRL